MEPDFSVARLGDVAEVRSGFAFKSSDMGKFGVPLIKIKNIMPPTVDVQDVERVPEETIKSIPKVERYKLEHRDILIAMTGATVGKIGRFPKTEGTFYLNQRVGKVYLKDAGAADYDFIYYVLVQPHYVEQMFGLADGSAQANISGSQIEHLKIPLPHLSKQRSIAHILGTLDDKVELNRQMNATLEVMARALFKSWFVDFDPVRTKLDGRQPPGLGPETATLFPASFNDSPLGPIPQGWEAIPLYDTATFINGAIFKNEDFCISGEGLPIVKIAELKDGISAQTKWSSRQADPGQLIDMGDLLYSWSGSPDTSLDTFLWSNGPGLLNQHIFKVIAPTTTQKHFVYYLLKYLRPILVETARNKQTTGLGHVTVADMKRLLVCLPSKEVLVAFDRIIGPIFNKAFANTLESQMLVTLRDTLLPKLMTGEIAIEGRYE